MLHLCWAIFLHSTTAVVLQSSTSTYRALPLDGLPSNYLEP